MSQLKARFAQVDRAEENLRKAENNLKAEIKNYALTQGLLIHPRKETLRASLNL